MSSRYMIDGRNSYQSIQSGHLRLGGTNPQGDTLSLNNYYPEMNGKPYFPISGEFHFSRYPYQFWEAEIFKIKLAGVDVISTYIFWIYHEEEEGRFNWDGNNNIRYFVDLCAKHGIYLLLRIGPFAHGECRNGGFPDWLYGRPFEVRSNDEEYLFYVKRFYREIGRQVAGQLFKDGGPIIGIQLENEYTASSAKWEPTILQGDEWIPTGAGGVEHMRILKQLALEAGFDLPLYTCTAWGKAPVLENELLPMWGGYAFQPWLLYWNSQITEYPPTDNYIFRDYRRNSSGYLDASYPTEQYPFACCEIGGGMQTWYNCRFVAPPESVEAMVINRVAGGCNFIGYYMFHGGSAPVGKHSYLNERCVPKISYDFQAPLGEFGQMKDSYRYLKPLHLFFHDFAGLLCPMQTVLPDGAEKIQPADTETVRFAARVNGDSGFLFFTNYQDHLAVKNHEKIRITVKLPGEELMIPAGAGFALKENVSAILPFNLNLDGVLLKYATAQLITAIKVHDEPYYFFFAPEGMAGEYCLDAESCQEVAAENGIVTSSGNRFHVSVTPGLNCWITVVTNIGKQVHIGTLTRKQALGFWKVRLWGEERVIITDATVLTGAGSLELRQAGDPHFKFRIFPGMSGKELSEDGTPLPKSRDGIFSCYSLKVPLKTVNLEWRKVAAGKAVLRVPPEAFAGGNELFLRIDYRGDVGNAFIDGRLIHDNFYNGEVWEIGLRRFYPEAAEKEICLSISPLRRGNIVYSDASLAVKADFVGDEIVEIRSIELLPEYKITVSPSDYCILLNSAVQ